MSNALEQKELKEMTIYSQNLEQQVIEEYFKGYVGTFCDIGANDGITFSNTRRLYELGWRGVLVEPSPSAFKKLKQNYVGVNKVYLYPFAIGTHNGRMRFWDSGTHLNNGDVALLSTSNPEELNRFPGTEFQEMEVKCFRWKTALNRWVIKDFDFISIDAEGLDIELIQQIDLCLIKCVCIEWNSNMKLKKSYDDYFGNEFRIIYTSGENLIYAR